MTSPHADDDHEKVTPIEPPPDPPNRPIGFITHEDKKDTPKGAAKVAIKVGRSKKT